MAKLHHPTKEQVRNWMNHRHTDHHPLPDIKQIRRELGWGPVKIAAGCKLG